MVGRLNDGGIEFSTYRTSAKVRHLLANPMASCLVVPARRDADNRTVLVTGAVSIREDERATEVVKAHAGAGRSASRYPARSPRP